ncbi:MAG: Holliday junction resolvase RuvX [Bacteroidota bacterium]
MRIIGLDYGEHRIGVAISDELGLTAQAVEGYTRQGRRADLAYLARLVGETGADTIVVGLPLNMNGTRGPAAEAAARFGRDLERTTGCRVVFSDERLTTVAAQRDLIALDVSRGRRRQVVDQTAAALILQGYLDRLRRTGASERKEREE